VQSLVLLCSVAWILDLTLLYALSEPMWELSYSSCSGAHSRSVDSWLLCRRRRLWWNHIAGAWMSSSSLSPSDVLGKSSNCCTMLGCSLNAALGGSRIDAWRILFVRVLLAGTVAPSDGMSVCVTDGAWISRDKPALTLHIAGGVGTRLSIVSKNSSWTRWYLRLSSLRFGWKATAQQTLLSNPNLKS